MSVLSSRHTRSIGAFSASLAIVLAALVAASPAQAAIGVDLNASAATITEGESVTLSWTSTDAIDLVAGGSWSGNKATPAGSEELTPAAGTYTYTLLATDENGREDTDEVTVVVEAAEPAADPLTVVNSCDAVTFTNTTDRALHVQYLWYDEQSEETTGGDFTLAAGATEQLTRSGPAGVWNVTEVGDPETSLQDGNLQEPQNCGDVDNDDSDNPKALPVAGA